MSFIKVLENRHKNNMRRFSIEYRLQSSFYLKQQQLIEYLRQTEQEKTEDKKFRISLIKTLFRSNLDISSEKKSKKEFQIRKSKNNISYQIQKQLKYQRFQSMPLQKVDMNKTTKISVKSLEKKNKTFSKPKKQKKPPKIFNQIIDTQLQNDLKKHRKHSLLQKAKWFKSIQENRLNKNIRQNLIKVQKNNLVKKPNFIELKSKQILSHSLLR